MSNTATLFNFADLSDLPEDLRKPLETETLDDAKNYAQIVVDAKAAGYDSLNIRQITAVAFRLYGKVPTQNTIRAYLNEAVKLKLIGKPTRASYSADTSIVVEDDESGDAAEAEVATTTEEFDPLANI